MKTIKPRKLHLKKTIDVEPIEVKENIYQNKLRFNKKEEISIPVLIILILITSLISSTLGAYFMIASSSKQTTTTSGGITTSTVALTETNSISKSVSKIYDAVVVVEVFDKKNNKVSTGTGFVYKKENGKAYLMTNNHVINKGESIKVLFTDKTTLDAEIVGSDTYSDIAVLKVDDSDKIVSAVMGKSTKSKVGDTVFTVGSPEGSEYAGTVTKGIISGSDRLVAVALENGKTTDYYMQVLQTDAAINPGNSGGPICNTNGEVIGITNMKLVDDTVEGMGFAIPIEEALKVVEILETKGEISRPKLGITVTEITNKIQIYYQYGILVPNDIEEGLVVVSTEKNSAAEEAKLKKGDVITKLAGKKATTLANFRYELYKHNPGEEIEVTYIRDGEENTIKLKLK